MKETVGSRIKALAIAKALRERKPPPTIEQIAESLDVSYESLRKWSAGKTAPNRKRAEKIAAFLGCPPESFMHGVKPDEDDDAGPADAPPPASASIAYLTELAAKLDPDRMRRLIAAADMLAGPHGDQITITFSISPHAGEPTPAHEPAS